MPDTVPKPTLTPLTPFFIKLKKSHLVDKVTSYTYQQLQASLDPELRELAGDLYALQLYAEAGNAPGYDNKLIELHKVLADTGIEFRSTKGVVYLTRNEGEKVDVKVALQIKGHSLTWYFWAEGAMDQYPQSFRDLLYNQAAECHKTVHNGCDLYYRGSNSVHVKEMHHHESESGHNHNHYRLRGNHDYTPEDVTQHLRGFKGCRIHDQFFEPGEIDKISEQFSAYHADWTTTIDGQPSKKEQYFSHPSQKINLGDMIELHLFGRMQEPCRLSAEELKVDYEMARRAIEDAIQAKETADPDSDLPAMREIDELKNQLDRVQMQYEELLSYRRVGGIRGLHSSVASARQIEGSQNPVIRKSQRMDDSIGKEVPDIPEWAHTLRTIADATHQTMLQSARNKCEHRQFTKHDVAMEWLALTHPDKREEVTTLLLHDLDIVAPPNSPVNAMEQVKFAEIKADLQHLRDTNKPSGNTPTLH